MDRCVLMSALKLLLVFSFSLLYGQNYEGVSKDIIEQLEFLSNLSSGRVGASKELDVEQQKIDFESLLSEEKMSAQPFRLESPGTEVLMFSLKPETFTGMETSSKHLKPTKRHAMRFPAEILKNKTEGEYRLICVYFDSSALFKDGKNSCLLNDNVLGATLFGSRVENLRSNVEIRFWHQQKLDESNAQCVWWIPGKGGQPGNWTTKDCRTVHQPNLTLCLCNHLTYFAVLLQISPATLDAQVLASVTYITYVGCSVSAVASLLTILMFIFRRKRKNDCTTKIHMNLLGALFLLNVCFLSNEPLAGASEDLTWLCTAAAAVLHGCLLCCFTWMAIEGFHLYLLLVKVYNIYVRHYLHKLCAVGWGLPILTVSLTVLIRREVYGLHTIATNEGYQNRTMCWVVSREVHIGVNLVYAGAVLVFNTVILIIVARNIRTLRADKGRACRDTLTVLWLSCLLGTTWALAFFSFGVLLVPQLFAFTILNSLQGFLIFLWFCRVQTHAEGPAESVPTNTTS